MINILYSDIYRLRRGAALRGTLIGLLVLILFLIGTMVVVSSDSFSNYIERNSRELLTEGAASSGMSASEIAEMEESLGEIEQIAPANGAEFAFELLTDNMLAFFLLPLMLAVFCADFSAGTYRNTLSYESNRTKVYFAKLLLSVLCHVFLVVATVLICWAAGSIAFGFGGFTATYFARLAIFQLLMLPIQLGIIGFCHCVIAFTRKSGATIAIFLIGLTVLSVLIQSLAMLPGLDWLNLLDWNSVGNMMANYQEAAPTKILVAVGFGLLTAVGTTALGLIRFRTADMD